MPFAGRKRKSSSKGTNKRRKMPYARNYAASKLQAVVRRALNRNIETKHGLQSPGDGIEILHNNFVVISSTPLATRIGPNDEADNKGMRIGDEINLKGMSLKFMAELNERYSDVTFRLFIVKSAKGDVPTRATMFNGISGNKMIDTFNRERFTKIHSQTFKIKAPNTGTIGGGNYGGDAVSNTGLNAVWNYESLSRATKLVKVWVPGHKFVHNGRVQYENGSEQVKFFDYHIVLYAYSNYTTSQDYYNIGRLNDAVIQLYYKDP